MLYRRLTVSGCFLLSYCPAVSDNKGCTIFICNTYNLNNIVENFNLLFSRTLLFYLNVYHFYQTNILLYLFRVYLLDEYGFAKLFEYFADVCLILFRCQI